MGKPVKQLVEWDQHLPTDWEDWKREDREWRQEEAERIDKLISALSHWQRKGLMPVVHIGTKECVLAWKCVDIKGYGHCSAPHQVGHWTRYVENEQCDEGNVCAGPRGAATDYSQNHKYLAVVAVPLDYLSADQEGVFSTPCVFTLGIYEILSVGEDCEFRLIQGQDALSLLGT